MKCWYYLMRAELWVASISRPHEYVEWFKVSMLDQSSAEYSIQFKFGFGGSDLLLFFWQKNMTNWITSKYFYIQVVHVHNVVYITKHWNMVKGGSYSAFRTTNKSLFKVTNDHSLNSVYFVDFSFHILLLKRHTNWCG